LPYLTALLVGVTAGTLANSPVVAALATLVFATVWTYADHRSNRPP